MGRLALPLVVVCIALSGALSACGSGGDDGFNLAEDTPALPAEGSGGADDGLPAVEGDGLLAPRKDRAPKKHKRGAKKAKAHAKKGKKKASKGEGDVAGARESNPSTGGSLTIGKDKPAPNPAPEKQAPGRKPSLSRSQKADLDSVAHRLSELFDRMNARDASLCSEMFTARHLEEATGKSGADALEKCRADVSGSKVKFSLNKISGVRIVGDRAWIRFASSAGDWARWQSFRAVRSGSSWRFDGDGSADF